MNEEHEPGHCYACGQDKPVRWKNLYTIGSEGTNLCMECELVVVNLLRKMAGEAMLRKRDEYVAKRKLRDQADKNHLAVLRSSDDVYDLGV